MQREKKLPRSIVCRKKGWVVVELEKEGDGDGEKKARLGLEPEGEVEPEGRSSQVLPFGSTSPRYSLFCVLRPQVLLVLLYCHVLWPGAVLFQIHERFYSGLHLFY